MFIDLILHGGAFEGKHEKFELEDCGVFALRFGWLLTLFGGTPLRPEFCRKFSNKYIAELQLLRNWSIKMDPLFQRIPFLYD